MPKQSVSREILHAMKAGANTDFELARASALLKQGNCKAVGEGVVIGILKQNQLIIAPASYGFTYRDREHLSKGH